MADEVEPTRGDAPGDAEHEGQVGVPPDLQTPDPTVQVEDTDALGAQVVHGLRWSFVNQVVNRVLTFGTGIIVLRLLSVNDVGIYAVGAAITGILMAVNELGLIPAIVQWQGDHHRPVGTAYTIAIVNSTFLALLVVLAAPWIADFSGSPSATGVIRVLALTIIVDGVTSMPSALLVREFSQKRIAVAETTGLVFQAVLIISLAFAGFGAYSLAFGMLFSNILVAVLLLVLAPITPIPQWRKEFVKPLMRFGGPIAGSSILRDAAINLDKIGVGAMLGTRALGYYQTAFNFSSLPANSLGQVVSRVAFAGFSRLISAPAQLDRSFRRSWVLLLTILAPMCALIAALAEPIISFIYGSKWLPSAPVLSILVVMSGLRVLFMLAADLISATGRPKVEFRLYVVWTIVLVPAFILGAQVDGIRGVAIAQLAVVGLLLMPLVLRALHPCGIHVRSVVMGSIRPVVAGLAAGIVAWPVGSALDAHPFVACLVGSVAGSVVFLAIVLPANPDLDLSLLRRLLTRNRAPSEPSVPA